MPRAYRYKDGETGRPVAPAPKPKKKRATPKTARKVLRPSKAPMVEQVMVSEEVIGSPLVITVDQLAKELLRLGRPTTAKLLAPYLNMPENWIVAAGSRERPAWRISFDGVYPSQNVLMRTYANHHAYARLIKMWADRFWAAMVEGKIPRATTRRRLTITRFVREEKYKLDRGNLVGGGKPFLDAAVRVGLIRNDREEDVDDIYRQATSADEHVEILVQDL